MEKDASVSEMKKRLRDSERPVILYAWAPWCGPCRAMEPALKRAKEVHQGQVDVWKLNADEKPDLARELGVWSVPTLIVFRDGSEIKRSSGAQSSAALNSLFQAAVTGEMPAATGVALNDRVLRLGAGLVLFGLGLAAGPSLLLIGLSGVLIFSGVHDRCPLWQALKPRMARLVRRTTST